MILNTAQYMAKPSVSFQTNFIGIECSLAPCVQRIQANVTHGVYKEQILETFMDVDYPSGTATGNSICQLEVTCKLVCIAERR
jgi:hypothetical protein